MGIGAYRMDCYTDWGNYRCGNLLCHNEVHYEKMNILESGSRMLLAFTLLSLASPSFIALFCLRGERSRSWLALIVRFNLMMLKPLAPDADTKRFLTDFPAMIANDPIDPNS